MNHELGIAIIIPLAGLAIFYLLVLIDLIRTRNDPHAPGRIWEVDNPNN